MTNSIGSPPTPQGGDIMPLSSGVDMTIMVDDRPDFVGKSFSVGYYYYLDSCPGVLFTYTSGRGAVLNFVCDESGLFYYIQGS